MVASIIKTTQIDKVPSVVNTGASGGMGLIRWGYTENVIIIITSSVPCIRPLFISSVRKVSSATRSWSHELSAAGRRSKNASSKSTSRNTWSKNESSGTREVSAGYAGKVDEEAGFGYGYGTEGETEVEGEIGVARGWSEENSLPGQDGLSGGVADGRGYHSATASRSGSGLGSESGSGSGSAAPSRPGSEHSGGITKQVGFSVVSSEGDSPR